MDDSRADDAFAPAVGFCSRKGKRQFNCDSVAVHRIASTGVVAVALVDGTGNSAEVAGDAFLCAQAAARVGAKKDVLPGVLAATDILGADPAVEFPSPDGVLALAVCWPVKPVAIGYVGDPAAFGYDPCPGGSGAPELTRLTEDHTMGQRMRLHGRPEEVAAQYDSMITTSIGRASVGTITVVSTDAPIVLLTSDGVHRALSNEQIAAILAQHPAHADTAAMAVVEAAQEAGSVDDATAAVILLPWRRDQQTES